MRDYAALKPFASPAQLRHLQAVIDHGSLKTASEATGVNQRTIERAIEQVTKKATLQGFSPPHDMTHPAPDGYKVKGVSTLYTPDGVAAQWVKTDIDREQMLQIVREVVDAMSSDIKREKPVKAPKGESASQLNLYPITDYHFGMYSWREETGADWDLDIAEDLLVAFFSKAIVSSPTADRGVLALMGDLLHWDGLDAVTPEHRNILDADSRFEKLVRVVIRSVRRVVRLLLLKHLDLQVIIAEGNHDPASSAWLREFFAALYEDEPRITVDTSPDPYYCVEFGETSLFFHHGHRRNPSNVADVFAAKFRDVFGRTKHSYAHLGHKHSAELKETNLMKIEQHSTLAAPDAYAARGGWISSRAATVITYDKTYGEVGRVVISPELAWASSDKANL